MCSERSAEVLDFVIKALREHEEWLDSFAKELKAIVERLGKVKRSVPVFRCGTWKEFKEKSRGAESVRFQWTGGNLTINALSKGKVYRYVLEAGGIKSWLSYLLNVPEEMIMKGRLVSDSM